MALMRTAPKKGLEAVARPGSFDIKGQQKELFPFDAFEFIPPNASGSTPTVTLKEPWIFGIKENQITSSQLAENAVGPEALVFGEGGNSFGTLSHLSAEGGIYGLLEDTSGLLSDGSNPDDKIILPAENVKTWAGDRTIEFLSKKYWNGWSWVNAGPETDGTITIGLKTFSVDDLINDVDTLINDIDELING